MLCNYLQNVAAITYIFVLQLSTFLFYNKHLTEADEHLHDRWLQEFCIQVPDKEIRKQLEQIIKQQYQEQGMEDPTETDIV